MEKAGGPEHVVTWQRRIEVFEASVRQEKIKIQIEIWSLDTGFSVMFSVIGGSS